MKTRKCVGEPVLGYSQYVTLVAISNGGNRIASGSGDDKLRIWERGAGALVRTIPNPNSAIICPVRLFICIERTIMLLKEDEAQNSEGLVLATFEATVLEWTFDSER